MSYTPTPPEIRAAKKFLERKRVDTDQISPRLFAQASKELDQGFRATYEQLTSEVEED